VSLYNPGITRAPNGTSIQTTGNGGFMLQIYLVHMASGQENGVVQNLHKNTQKSHSSTSTYTVTDMHALPTNSRMTVHPWRSTWTWPFIQKMKPGFCTCPITQ